MVRVKGDGDKEWGERVRDEGLGAYGGKGW